MPSSSTLLRAQLKRPDLAEALERVRQRWGEHAPTELLQRVLDDKRGGEPIAMTFQEAGPFAWVKVERPHTGMNWVYYVRAERDFIHDEVHVTLPLALRDAQAMLREASEHVLTMYEVLAYSKVARSHTEVEQWRGYSLREDGSSALEPDARTHFRVPYFRGDWFMFCASYPWQGVLQGVRVRSHTFEVETVPLGPGPFVYPPEGREYRDAGISVRAQLVEGRCDTIPSTAPVEHRAALARAWREQGLSEHASLGSFARAQAELLAMGVPLSLLTRMHQAALDEVRHAELAFGVAAGLDGRSLLAGPLPALAPREPSWRRVIEDTLHEAVIPETLSAAELQAAAREAHDPVLSRLLHNIAEDEEMHASLAWDTLAWALAHAPPADREGLHGLTFPVWTGHDGLPVGFGFLGARERADMHAKVWQEQIVPRLTALTT